MAVITVSPETSTERPDVAAAASSAAFAASRGPFLAFTLQVEERVVDADGEPDQEHERTGLVRHREDVRPGDDAEGREDGRQGEQQRDPRGDESAEREHEDDERDRERQHPGLAEVLLDGRRERIDRAGHAELADVELRVRLLGGVDLGENRIDLLGRLIGCADLELDQRRVSVGRPARCGRSARVELREPRHDVADRGREGVGRRERAALDQDALRGRALEARVENPVHPARAARRCSGRSTSCRPCRARRRRRRTRASRTSPSSSGRTPPPHAGGEVLLGVAAGTSCLLGGCELPPTTLGRRDPVSSEGRVRAPTRRRFRLLPE